jgi:nucleoside-diphosphate-sugar epimerase
MTTVLVTGAAGRIGTVLRHAFSGWRTVRCLDTVRPRRTLPGEEWTVGDVTDAAPLRAAADGADTIVHLAANAAPTASWAEVNGPNVDGTRVMYEVAVAAGVRSVVFASSHHASGGYDRDGVAGVEADWPPRPCCPYGVTKVLGEALGRYHADRDGLSVTCLRIGGFAERPHDALDLRIWVSPGDLTRAFTAALFPRRPFGVHLVCSANTRSRWNGRLPGYAPRDDAEEFAAEVASVEPVLPCFRP